MRQWHVRVWCVVASLLGAAHGAAQRAVPTVAPQTPPLPYVALPPALDRVLREYERAWHQRDAAGLAALFATDGFVLQSGRAPVRGRAAIAALYADQGGAPLRLRALASSVADTIGYVIGVYGYSSEREDVGKFTLTLRRDPGGRWLIVSDMDNTSRPPR
ncbi:MAG: nuclear transport factor 2 family protein [Gemmatimonadaceae bacterium]|jgi:uncharacterized protein (TIGR02246 family)|nr:nuclear transport factor 2 family protein [Gemmatimonadaceae bacterium]